MHFELIKGYGNFSSCSQSNSLANIISEDLNSASAAHCFFKGTVALKLVWLDNG